MHGPRAPNQSGPEKAKRELPGKTNKSVCMNRERQIRAGPEKAKRELPGKTNKSECMDRERQIRAGAESAKPECSEKQKQINQNVWTESSKSEWPKKCKSRMAQTEKKKKKKKNQNAWPKSAKSVWPRKSQTGIARKPNKSECMAQERQIRVAPKVPNRNGPKARNQNGPKAQKAQNWNAVDQKCQIRTA